MFCFHCLLLLCFLNLSEGLSLHLFSLSALVCLFGIYSFVCVLFLDVNLFSLCLKVWHSQEDCCFIAYCRVITVFSVQSFIALTMSARVLVIVYDLCV